MDWQQVRELPEKSWLLSEVASPSILLLLSLCHILHHASKAVMHPYWNGLEINSFKKITQQIKISLVIMLALFLAILWTKSETWSSWRIIPSVNWNTSQNVLPAKSCKSRRSSVVAAKAVTLPKPCSNCASWLSSCPKGKPTHPGWGFCFCLLCGRSGRILGSVL